MARIDPLRNFRYRLEIDSITQAAFSEVMIGETTIDAVDYRDGTDPPHVQQALGPHQVRQHHAQVGPLRRRQRARPLQVAQGRLRGPGEVEAQEGRHRRAGRGRRGCRALRRERGVADQVRRDRSQRQGQRSADRARSSS